MLGADEGCQRKHPPLNRSVKYSTAEFLRRSSLNVSFAKIQKRIEIRLGATVDNFVAARAPDLNKVKRSSIGGPKRFNSNHLESGEIREFPHALESGSGPGGRWFKSTRPDHSFPSIFNEIAPAAWCCVFTAVDEIVGGQYLTVLHAGSTEQLN